MNAMHAANDLPQRLAATPTVDRSQRYCVIGAGSSGLAAIKNLRQAGLEVDCLEREDDVGGNWYYGKPHSSVYRSTRLISSKRLTQYTDFPMPAEWPEYPGHAQAWEYLRSYARHFGLYESIEFGVSVERVEPLAQGWQVRLASGEQRHYRGLLIANGHNWKPRWPELPGEFHGALLHASQYKTPDVLSDRRVLVIGAGNSGCDIAVESAHVASATFHSMRRGYHYLPKFIGGRPADEVGEWMLRLRLPLWLRRRFSRMIGRLVLGSPEMYGLPKPDHRLFETHPIINSQMPYYVAHGLVQVRPNVAELCGHEVLFADGTRQAIDVIVCATGYEISFPFIDRVHLNWHAGRPELYLQVFHPQRDDLAVIGLIQPDSGQWGLADYQSQVVARFLQAAAAGQPAAERFRRERQQGTGDERFRNGYLDSPRHLLEVEHFSYRRELQRALRRLGSG